MRGLLSVGLLLCLIGLTMMFCNSPGVERVPSLDSKIYRLQGDYYVRRLVVDTEVLFIRCDKEGNLLSGPISTHYGKNGHTTAIGE